LKNERNEIGGGQRGKEPERVSTETRIKAPSELMKSFVKQHDSREKKGKKKQTRAPGDAEVISLTKKKKSELRGIKEIEQGSAGTGGYHRWERRSLNSNDFDGKPN